MKKIIFDTDLGGDIDDALALALAVNSPEIEIIGITSVYLGAMWRAGIILRMLDVFEKKNIPVFAGAQKPLIGFWGEHTVPDSANSLENNPGISNMPACDFIAKTVNENEKVTILAIGPLTNIALAISKDPEIAKKANLVLMGGQIFRANPEWNIKCDPEAARIVFESNIPITMIGLDVTEKCRLDHNQISSIKAAGNKRCDLLCEMIDTFLTQFDFMPTLHDPLALAAIIWPELMEYETKTILVETKGEFTRGVTVDSVQNHLQNAKVAISVKSEEFLSKFLDRIKL